MTIQKFEEMTKRATERALERIKKYGKLEDSQAMKRLNEKLKELIK